MIELRTYITDYSDSIVGTEARTVSKTIEEKQKSFLCLLMSLCFELWYENDMHENDIMEDIRAL